MFFFFFSFWLHLHFQPFVGHFPTFLRPVAAITFSHQMLKCFISIFRMFSTVCCEYNLGLTQHPNFFLTRFFKICRSFTFSLLRYLLGPFHTFLRQTITLAAGFLVLIISVESVSTLTLDRLCWTSSAEEEGSNG